MPIMKKLNDALESVRKHTDFVPQVALVLGSGLGGFADKMKIESTLSYNDIEGFPTSTVAGHAGQFVFGHVGDAAVVAMQGRVHYYEGYPMSDVVMPIRLMGLMGAKVLFLSNAAGGCNYGYSPGDLMLIRDHISSMVPSPLIGRNLDNLGPRFPDMSDVYSKDLRKIIRASAEEQGVFLREGVYMQFTGPQYETPSEVRYALDCGADAVGMSTACEAVAANHMGLKVCGISCITNLAAGISPTPLNHEEVQEVADMAAENFQSLVAAAIQDIVKKSNLF